MIAMIYEFGRYILLKFMKDEYVSSFLDGNIYMNTLHFFWNEYPLREALRKKEELLRLHPEANPEDVIVFIDNQMPRMQEDVLEGQIDPDAANTALAEAVSGIWDNHLLTDIMFRAEGYKYCNIACFYKLSYAFIPPFLHYDIAESMTELGGSVVIIDDEHKFLERVRCAAEREGYKYLCGSVVYKSLKRNGIASDLNARHHVLIASDNLFDIRNTEGVIERDCFVKTDQYKHQNEWRIALYRGVRDTGAYTLCTGNLRDIAHSVKAGELCGELDRLFAGGHVRPCFAGYFGNTDRQEMKKLFCALGSNKARMFTVIG